MPTAKRKTPHLAVVTHDEIVSKSTTKYEAIFENASDAIVTVNASGKIDAVNRAFEELTGYLKSELLGESVTLLVPKPSPQSTLANRRIRPVSEESCRTPGTYEEVVIAKKDGYIRYVDLSVREVSQPKIYVCLFRDVTEKKNMERELITKHSELRNAYVELEKKNAELQSMQQTLVQSGKMAALGELAAGIAHELNQPLQGIRGYAQELKALIGAGTASTPDTGDAPVFAQEIISNVDKMASIIEYLRTFTRKSTENFEQTDVHHAIEESLKMLGRQLSARGIEVLKKFDDKLPRVYANPVALEQVFINLAGNARDAIDATQRGRGTITIETKRAGKFIEIHFKDDGAGMSERTRAKVFNPFFTTKEVGKGMGLGLSLSYGILSTLNGSILVESELGKGTTFVVRVPQDFRETA